MDGIDKVWAPLAGAPVLAHSIRVADEVASELVVVIKQADEVRVVQMLEGLRLRIPWRITRGGARRQDSVKSGLRAVRAGESVAVHDAARPLATPDLFKRVWAASLHGGAAIPAVPLSDTIKRVENEQVVQTLDRRNLWAVQTPQVFDMRLLSGIYNHIDVDEQVTDDASLMEASGNPVAVVTGEPWNFKVTTPADLQLAGAILAFRQDQSESPRRAL